MIAFIRGTRIPVVIVVMPLSENGIEGGGEPAVTVSDQVLHGGADLLQVHDQIPGHLGGPGCGGVCGCAEDADAAGGVLENDEDGELRSGQGVDYEEVGGEECVGLAAQEGGPGQVVAVRRGLDVVGCEDLPDGGGRDFDSQGGEFTVDSAVTPAGVVARQAQDEDSNAADDGTSAGLFGASDPGVAATQKVAVPTQDGVGRDDQVKPSQRWSGDHVEQGGEKRPVR